jgi:very-short-patch-repair endonuclease
MTPDAAINTLALTQFGLFTRAQAVQRGATDMFLKRRVNRQLYRGVRRGVYAVTSVPPSWHQDVLAVCLGRTGTFAATRTAAALWELPGFRPGPLEFCSVRNVRSADRVRIRRVMTMAGGQVARVGPIPTTSATRTILDLSTEVEPAKLETALDHALRRGLTSIEFLARSLEDLFGQAKIRSSVVRGLLETRSAMGRPPESPLETRVIQLLRRHGLPPPVPQHEIRQASFLARVDLAYPNEQVAIEVDGYEFHSGRRQWERDLIRRNTLEAAGWRVLHVTAEQVRTNSQRVVATVRQVLQERNGRQLSLDDSYRPKEGG